MNASVKLLDATVPTAVAVQARVAETHPSTAVLGTQRHGSGVCIDPDGLILTANYSVLGAQETEVTNLHGRTQPARVAAQDFGTGLALLETAPGFAAAAPARGLQGVCPGQQVFAVAAGPNNERRVNSGGVAAIERFDANWEFSLDRALYSTLMNPGLGGAPLFDTHGRVVALVVLELAEVGRFSLAAPLDELLDHRAELLRCGRRMSRPPRAWIGIFCYSLKSHIVLAGVLPRSPAEKAGLRPGDVVLAIDDVPVSSRGELYGRLWAHSPGATIHVRVFRDRETKQIAVASTDADTFFA